MKKKKIAFVLLMRKIATEILGMREVFFEWLGGFDESSCRLTGCVVYRVSSKDGCKFG